MLSPLSRRLFSRLFLLFFLFWGMPIRGFWLKPGKNPPDHALKRHGLRRVSFVNHVPGEAGTWLTAFLLVRGWQCWMIIGVLREIEGLVEIANLIETITR